MDDAPGLGPIRVGTSGWTYDHWKGTFYPAGLKAADRLGYYAERFGTVELNGSHYRWPADTTVERWRDALPDGFRMAVKASRYLTHYRKLRDPADWCERITHTLDLLGDKAGPLVVQLPADLHRDDARLSGFLGLLPERVLVAVEPQHESWLDDDVFALLDRHDAGFVVSVVAEREPVLRAVGRLAYLRFHNSDPQWRYGGSFDDDDLAAWVPAVQDLAAEGRSVWCYFNNDNHGYAAFNAQTLQEMLRAAAPPTLPS
ncbi:DUF72 domain-containing protein [Arsenicicoccus sp. oral taxon 190]|uniref:DUF72 domain-containing protein n=1 Tax=Arsenicicoccus sp. oral taxon 190 TaxID=1658671 RepID=UPI000679FE07|nr:DUF72 domain-containing protein [Arsenicicoccus sp. oral taxon 190]AKT51001.1 sensor histidine kinase [Arsenicicoccus sp. oral taxon 190]